jgi:hypothetical protein
MFHRYSIRLTSHARDQINARGVTTADEVLRAVNSVQSQVLSSQAWQVKVVIKTLPSRISVAGSEGNVVVACVDPVNKTIKTLMLEGQEQVWGRSKSGRTGEYVYA